MDSQIFKNLKAKQIQNFYRTHKIKISQKKLQDLNLKPLGNCIKFEEFTRKIRNKNFLNTVNEFINILSKNTNIDIKINSRIILSGYLVNYYAEELLENEKNRHPVDKSFLEWSNKMVELLEDSLIKNIIEAKKLSIYLNNYKDVFEQWKIMDKNKTIEKIIISYYNRSEHLEIINKDEKLDGTQKEEMVKELENQREKLLYDIMLIDPNFNTDYLKTNYKEIYNELKKNWSQILQQTGNTMKKAYYDMISKELNDGNMKPMYDLFVEIYKRILLITPEKRRGSLAEKLNPNKISDLLYDLDWNDELLKHINMLSDIILMFSAPIDDESNKKWKEELKYINKYDFSKKLPQVLIQIEEKLDQIYRLIIMANQQNKKK
jgi:hypothetical protein